MARPRRVFARARRRMRRARLGLAVLFCILGAAAFVAAASRFDVESDVALGSAGARTRGAGDASLCLELDAQALDAVGVEARLGCARVVDAHASPVARDDRAPTPAPAVTTPVPAPPPAPAPPAAVHDTPSGWRERLVDAFLDAMHEAAERVRGGADGEQERGGAGEGDGAGAADGDGAPDQATQEGGEPAAEADAWSRAARATPGAPSAQRAADGASPASPCRERCGDGPTPPEPTQAPWSEGDAAARAGLLERLIGTLRAYLRVG